MPTKVFSAGDDERGVELLRHSPDLLVELGLDGRLLYVSQASTTILGRRPEELIGLSFMEVIAPEERATALASFRKIVETGAQPTLRLRVPRTDGLEVLLELSVQSFRDPESGQTRICVSGRDITQRHAEQAVDRIRNDHYRTIVESGSHPALVANDRGEILFSNRRFQSLFGRVDHLGTLADRLTPATRRAAEHAWALSNQSDGHGSIDFEIEEKGHGTRSLSAIWQALRAAEGEERRYSILIEDITRRKSAEEAFRTLAEGPAWSDAQSARRLVALFARALDLDRLIFGLRDPDAADRIRIVAGWQDGRFLTEESLELRELPDADVLRGESCIHPACLHQLMPGVLERLGDRFDAYAGLPLRIGDREVMGLIGGYARRPIRDPALMRSLLGVFASHATAGLHHRAAGLELRANQDRFEALARHSQDLLTETDSQGTLTYASDAATALLGYSREELVGRPIFDFVHPEDRSITAESFEALLAGREPPCHITRALHADGSWRWLESRVSGFSAADGTFRVLSLSRDITQQRHDTLGRNLLYSVVQQGADLVLVCEMDGTVRYANAVATRLLATAGDSSIEGQSLLGFLASRDASTLEVDVLPQLEEAGGWSGEIELRRPDSTERLPTEASIFLFSDPDASTRPLLAVTLRDIRDRRAAEAALRETESRLGQAQKMEAVGRLAGGIAHDFNNLLTAIIGYGDLLLDELGPDHRARRDAEEILNAAERAGALTRQLLAFSRRQVLQPELIDLNTVVADIDRLMRRLIGEDIQMVTMQDGGLASILADPSQIEQVILNLVVNARDAMPHGGRLEIETRNLTLERPMRTDSGMLEAGDYVELRVSDTGVGMDVATHARMFEPFFTTKTPDRGTGLGLATVYGIVSQSGGQIEAESRVGEGATFRVYLPTASARRQRGRHAPEDPVGAAVGGEETVVLVEDSDVVRALVERTLRAAGYRVLTADSATGALRHCSRHPDPIALLLTDVVLPRIDGPEIALRAREIRPDLRVLFMSGFSDEKLLEHGLARDEPNLIAKPFSPSDLLHAIRRVLDEPTTAPSDDELHVEQKQ